jgi:hypothetical protein
VTSTRSTPPINHVPGRRRTKLDRDNVDHGGTRRRATNEDHQLAHDVAGAGQTVWCIRRSDQFGSPQVSAATRRGALVSALWITASSLAALPRSLGPLLTRGALAVRGDRGRDLGARTRSRCSGGAKVQSLRFVVATIMPRRPATRSP